MVHKDNNEAGEKIASLLPLDETRKWWQRPNLVKLNLFILNFMLYGSAIGYDSAVTNSIQALTEWKSFMGNPVGTWLGFINSSSYTGACALILFVPYFCDRYGRKPVVFLTTLFIWLGAIVSAAANNQAAYIMGRVIIGFSAACNYAASLYINEIAYPTQRGKFGAAYHATFYIGSVLVAWIVFGTRGIVGNAAWRIPLALQALVPLLLFPGLIMAPESPRWLASRGRFDEAKEVLMKYHAGYEEQYVNLVEFEMREIIAALEIQQINKEFTWSTLVKTPGNRKRLFISCFLAVASQWGGNGIISSYLSSVFSSVGITRVWEQTLLNACIQIFNMLAAGVGVLFIDRLGRRTLLLIGTAGMFVAYIGLTAITAVYTEQDKPNIGSGIIVFIFICYGFYDIGYTPLVTSYISELWPQSTRSKGLFTGMFAVNASCFLNIFVNGIAITAIGWRYYCVYLGVQVVIFLTFFFVFPETKGHSLEEIALIFDKDEVTQNELNNVNIDFDEKDAARVRTRSVDSSSD